MENNIRQIRQAFKSLKQQAGRGPDSREMSRKSSRAHSRRGSMDILEEEMPVINANTMFPEEEEEDYIIRSKSTSLFGSRDELNEARSGDDLRSDDDNDISPAASRKTSSRRQSIVALPTGRWSRRSSLAGNEFLKMEDEMVQVHRSGSTFSIPRRLSHHVPTVPIIESEAFENKLMVKYHDLDSDEFQIYKKASVEEYNLVQKADMEIVGKQKFIFPKKSKNFTLVEQKIIELLKGCDVSPDEMIKLLEQVLTDENIKQMKEMLESGVTIENVIKYFLEKGELKKGELRKEELRTNTLQDKMKLLLGNKEVSETEMLKLLKNQLGQKSKEEMEEMLRKGYSMQEVIDYFMQHGKTQEEEASDFKQKMKSMLERTDLNPEEMLEILRSNLSEEEKKKMEEMLNSGMTMEDVIKKMIEKKEEDAHLAKDISNEETLDMLKKQLGNKSKEELDEMLKKGYSLAEVMEHFMKHGKSQQDEAVEFENKMNALLVRSDLNPEEKLDILRSNLTDEEKLILEQMLNSGMSIEDVVREMIERKNSGAAAQKSNKINDILGNPDLSVDQKLELLKGNMTSEEIEVIQKMIEQGITLEEALKSLISKDQSDIAPEGESEFAKRIRELQKNKKMESKELLELIQDNLDDDEKLRLNEMIRNGYSTQDIIKYFLKHGKGRQISEFETEIRRILSTQNLTEDQIIELLRSNLGAESLLRMEQMLKEGYTKAEIIKFMIEKGRTEKMEQEDLKSKIENFMSDSNISIDDKVNLVKNQLNEEAKALMEELIKQGYSKEEVMDLFLRCANNIELINNDKLFKKTVRFSDEPPDSYLYEGRDVWTMIDQAEVKLNIPFMTTSAKCVTFAAFFGKVVELTTGKGLTHREIMDLIRFRMGGDYAKEFDLQRSEGLSLQEIVDHFLLKDEINRQESMRKAKLRAQAKIDAELNLQRKAHKDKWGIALHYSISRETGLKLIIETVTENGPAWKSGVRPGDVIVTVDDWLITLMDKPQVACHLFQAGCNMVKLGIMRAANIHGDIGSLGLF